MCTELPPFRPKVEKSRNKELRDLFQAGVGCHHAGMLRSDRGLTERAFEDGAIKVRGFTTVWTLVRGLACFWVVRLLRLVLLSVLARQCWKQRG